MVLVLVPTPNRCEELGLFRHSIIADLVHSALDPGDLQKELKQRAKRRYRTPGSKVTRTFHWKTLQRWLYAARDGLAALQPQSRKRGFGLNLLPEARELLLDARREHPHVAAELLLDEAVRHGVCAEGAISLPTLRRMFAEAELSRPRVDRLTRARERRRWETDRVCRLWHADVCHVWCCAPGGKPFKAYVHAILDDHSRYILAMQARTAETENDLLELLIEALLRYPAPDGFYVDNGSTYSGRVLMLLVERLGIRLVHAKPYDPEARGKMERYWRTLRQRLLDVRERWTSVDDLNVALLAWLDADYHVHKHSGLMGDTPARRFRAGARDLPAPKTLGELARAMEVKHPALVRKDATFSVSGKQYEVRGRHLAGRKVDVILDPFTEKPIRVESDGQLLLFGPCDPQANARRGRSEVAAAAPSEAPKGTFDRIAGLLQAARAVRDE